jgi:pimeloyl-ACP methyl ester carboxylesterase
MTLCDRGQGDPLVLVPGIQGRWEYMRPTVDALATSFRVLTFSLCGEPGSSHHLDPAAGLNNDAAQVLGVLDQHNIERATICGVSFGGLVALRFAARFPDRVSTLVLASTPAPVWRLRRRHQVYSRLPWIFGPLFLAETPWRLRAEITAAMPDRRMRWRLRRHALRTFAAAPLSPGRMAARARLIDGIDMREECAAITAPTLVITGESPLDHVVPADGSSAYVRLIPNSRLVVLERSGHIGSITRPHAFAALVRDFIDGLSGNNTKTPTLPTSASPFLCVDTVSSVSSAPVSSVSSVPVSSVPSVPVSSVPSVPVSSVPSVRRK